ncbi:hypothetical protein REPUB_Repub18cG0055400 [Reevesia pubescens]
MKVNRNIPSALAIFQIYYVCFHALKTGLQNGCIHFFGLDGCFLKILSKGELLCVVERDGNNQIFPVAWALVEVECTDSWRWFINFSR